VNRKLIAALSGACLIAQFFLLDSCLIAKEESLPSKMSQEEYATALRVQDKIHGLIRQASSSEEKGDYQSALEYYLRAYEINKCGGLIAVCRGGLADNYEALGKYNEALDNVRWFLAKLKPTNNPTLDRTYFQMKAAEVHLLKKIEEQKKTSESVAKTYPQVMSADHERQKRFLESMQTKGVATSFKEAALLELDDKFAEARAVYEKLLPQKETITQEMGLANWVMLYPAIQRTSELTGDEAREKEALVWIRNNMTGANGPYHEYLSNLFPAVQDHLKERLKKFNLD